MITLLVLVSSVIAIAVCQDARLIVMGPTYIRPRQPYTVALANLFDSNAAVKLTLKCDDESAFQRNVRLVIRGQSIKSHSFAVPEISHSRCTFSAVDVGGRIPVNHKVELMFPTKTLSIFVLTDKPVYKLGDEIRLRVVVVDITTRPVKHINSVKIYLEDSDGYSRRRWTQAKLYTGMFEAAYQLPSSATVGTWTISVTAHDGSIENRKSQQFEVRESIMQELVVNVIPSRTLLISDKEISLHIASHHASGMPVRGKLRVDLFANKTSTEPSHRNFGNFHSSASITFKLKSQLHLPEGDDHVMVKTFLSLTEEISNVTSSFTKEIPVFLYPYKVSLIKPLPNYQPQSDYYCKLLITDHDGIPVKSEGMNATIKTGSDDVTAEMNNQGTAFVVLPMPNEVKNVTISVYFENLEYKNIEVIKGLQQTTTQHLNIYPMDRIIAGESVIFTVSSNKDFTNLYIFTEMRGSVQSMGCWKFNGKKSHKFGFRLTDDMAPFSRLLVFTINNNQIIMGSLELDFEYFANEFEHRLDRATYHLNQSLHIEVTAASDSLVAFQAIHQGTLPLGCHKFGLTRTQVLEDLEEYVGGRNSNNHDIINSFGLFLKTGEISLNLVPPTFPKRSRDKMLCVDKESILVNNNISETWLWTSISMDDQSTKTIAEVVPDTIISWYMTGFALSPTLGLGLMDAPQKFAVVKPFYITTHLPYSVKLNEIVRIEVTLYNFLDTPLATEVTLFNQNNEFECVDRAPTNSNHHRKDVVVSVDKETTVYFLAKTKKLGDIAIKIEATNQAAYDRVENILSVIQESLFYSFRNARMINFNSSSTKTFDILLMKPRGVDPDLITINFAIHNLFTPLDLGMISKMYDIPVRSHSGIPLAFIPNVAVLNYLMETKLSTPYNLRTSIYNDYKELLKYRHSSGAFSQWSPPKGKPSIYLTALVANSLGIASKCMDVDEMVIKRAFSWISEKQRSDGCFAEDGEMIASHVNDNLTPITLTAFIVAAVEENGDIAGQFNRLVKRATNCLANNFNLLHSTHDMALATYALSLTGYVNRSGYFGKLFEDSHFDHTRYERYWNEVLNVEIAGYVILSSISLGSASDNIFIMKWLNNQQYSIEGFDNVHSTFIALKSLGKMAAYANERRANFMVKIKHGETFEVDNLDSPIEKSFDVPGHAHSVDWSITGIGFCLIVMTHQYRTNIVSTTSRFHLNVTVLRSNNYNVQNLQVCLNFILREAYEQSGVTIVEVHLPSGLVFPNNTVHDLNHRIQKTERALGNTVMFVYYDDVGVNRVCFEITAHRKFMIANQQPSYVAAYKIHDDDDGLKSMSTYEGAFMSVCEICDDDDCKTMNCQKP